MVLPEIEEEIEDENLRRQSKLSLTSLLLGKSWQYLLMIKNLNPTANTFSKKTLISYV